MGLSRGMGRALACCAGALLAIFLGERITRLVEELTAQRAEERIGESVTVLVEEIEEETGRVSGRADHQGPDIDGATLLTGSTEGLTPGALVTATVVGTEGIDLVAEVTA